MRDSGCNTEADRRWNYNSFKVNIHIKQVKIIPIQPLIMQKYFLGFGHIFAIYFLKIINGYYGRLVILY